MNNQCFFAEHRHRLADFYSDDAIKEYPYWPMTVRRSSPRGSCWFTIKVSPGTFWTQWCGYVNRSWLSSATITNDTTLTTTEFDSLAWKWTKVFHWGLDIWEKVSTLSLHEEIHCSNRNRRCRLFGTDRLCRSQRADQRSSARLWFSRWILARLVERSLCSVCFYRNHVRCRRGCLRTLQHGKLVQFWISSRL